MTKRFDTKKLLEDLKDKSPVKFGFRTVISYAGNNGHHNKWNVKCDCGNEYTCLTQDLYRKGGARCKLCNNKGPRLRRRKRSYEHRYNACVNRARHPMLISYEEFFEFTKITECHYCGDFIEWGPAFGKKRPSGLNLDRKDSDLPYIIDNIVVACRRCNYGKNNFFSYEEWKEIGQVIRSWRDKNKSDKVNKMDSGQMAYLQEECEARASTKPTTETLPSTESKFTAKECRCKGKSGL